MLLIPAIDLRSGRCVRLYQGDFNAETRYAVTAQDLAGRYRGLGATWLHVVDLDGAKNGVLANRELIIDLVSSGLNLQVGGGVRSQEIVEDLLAHGVRRVVVGSTAVEQPETVRAWLSDFGTERVCLAFDVRLDAAGEPLVRTRGWTEDTRLTLWQALQPYGAAEASHVLCTDIARDGALAGPNLALYREAATRFPQFAWQASGGVRDARDLAALAEAGMAGAVSGKALLEDRIGFEELQPFLPNA